MTRIRFGRHVLDIDRGCLLDGDGEIALRPKTFAVLRFLIENNARLVSKEDLFTAVWSDLTVTDDVLVQSIGELRRALGEDGPRLIKTIPRRGYRFDAEVSPDVSIEEPAPPPLLLPQPPAPRTRRVGAALLIGLLLLTAGLVWAAIGPGGANPDSAASLRPGLADTGAEPTIAVLPFLNQGDDPEREYFANGLTQDIIAALGRFSKLTVMSWNSVRPYRGTPSSTGQIARDLAVRYQVEGTVRLAGERVRVSAQLVGADGRVLWSGRFDEALADVFLVQDAISSQVVGALAIRVTEAEQRRVFAKPTDSLAAYDLVLRARPALQRPSRTNNVEARALLRRAVDLDPRYAAAYASLAETYHIAVSMGWAESPRETLGRSEALANQAVGIDAADVRAHIILGRIHLFFQRYAEAKVEMDRAIAINPNDADALAGRGNALMWMGQTTAAIEELEAAQRIDPEMNAIDRFALSLGYYSQQRYQAAVEQAERNLRGTLDANFSRNVLAAAYAQSNRTEDAARVAAIIRRVDPTFEPGEFGTKFLNPADLAHLREGFRKAGLFAARDGAPAE